MKIVEWIRRVLGIQQIYRYEHELFNAQKFNSTISGSEWFRYQSISPGGAAVDYTFFYTLYRVLSSIKPNNILEFGLGQSSKMVHQYASFYGKKAITVEHDATWMDFFLMNKEGDYPIEVKLLDMIEVEYKRSKTLTYKDCLERLKSRSYDVIIVDGPFGKNFQYSRTQILEIAKSCIGDEFVIIMDDYNRKGEKNTVAELFSILDQKGVNYVFKVYNGLKSHILITTHRYRFLTTL